MKKLLIISAVVFLVIFTAGLATAKTVGPTFPFTGTGDLFSVSDTGVVGATTSATITVNEASNGLFWGTIVIASPSVTINFSAVLDSQGVYTFNGSGDDGDVTALGSFIITKEKEPGIKHKDFAAAIQFKTLGIVLPGGSWAGILFH
jgi:hypothetical protein